MRPARFTVFALGGMLLALAAIAGWWHWTEAASRHAAEVRGDELNTSIRHYQRRHQQQLPATDDWPALAAAGFTAEEMERAYPQYTQVSSTVYQLAFVRGFDGPYLMWDSGERRWKDGTPFIAAKRN